MVEDFSAVEPMEREPAGEARYARQARQILAENARRWGEESPAILGAYTQAIAALQHLEHVLGKDE